MRTAATLAALAGLALAGHALELERVVIYKTRLATGIPCCLTSTGVTACGIHTETWEKWESMAFAGGGIPWDLVQYPDGTLAPGLPMCTTYGAYRAVTAAADAWNTPPPPPPPTGGGRVQIQPVLKGSPILKSELAFQQAPTNVVTYDFSNPQNLLSSAAPNYVAFLTDAANAQQQLPGAPPGTPPFSVLGTSHVVLGISAVYLYNPPITVSPVAPIGSIQGFDIVLNALTYQGAPVWGWFVEEGSDDLASHEPGSFVPLDGYADVQGVLTHEFGHAAGLGHSVLDGETGGSQERVPTMFPFAQAKPLEGMLTVQSGCGPSAVQYAAAGSTTVYGGLLGRSARSLQPDDVAAINRGYPVGSFAGAHGTIRGRVVLGGAGVPAASVVAMNRVYPDVNRIGVLTYHVYPDEEMPAGELVGEYEISGLPPGDYYVVVEPVDRVLFPGGGDVPNYAFDAGTAPWPLCACGAPPPATCVAVCPGTTPCMMPSITGLTTASLSSSPFPREVYNAGDAASELRQLATLVSVTAGGVVSGVDLVLDSALANQPVLEVSTGAGPFTARGLTLPAWADASLAVPSTVDFRLSYPPGSYANAGVELLLSFELDAKTDNGQLREVSTTAGPPDLAGVLDGSGTIQITYPIDPASQLFRMIHAQVRIETAPGVYDYTNRVVVWVALQEPVPSHP